MKRSKLHSCNVLEVLPDERKLWEFAPENDGVSLERQTILPGAGPLPQKWVQKDWQSLWKNKLNVAWLPAGQVFLRVVHIPAGEPGELRSMIEFQLEKISPAPVGQIVWTAEPLRHHLEGMQAVVVVIAEREAVEGFLGRLEGDGFFADRLELRQLHHLLSMPVEEDGIWIYFDPKLEPPLALAAWWQDRTLQNVQIVHLPADQGAPAVLVEELSKMAWAGEIEGWWAAPLKVHLVSDVGADTPWSSALESWSGSPVVFIPPLSRDALAEVTARRIARDESHANLLPAEFGVAYRQKLIDRLWMGGLGAVIALYVAGVLIYFGVLEFLKFRQDRVQQQVVELSQNYTNALQLKERVSVLQNQLDLKYAALDSWKVASELLPTELTLDWLNFGGGDSLRLQGSGPANEAAPVHEYNQALRNAVINGERVFKSVSAPTIQNRQGVLAWNFVCELAKEEAP